MMVSIRFAADIALLDFCLKRSSLTFFSLFHVVFTIHNRKNKKQVKLTTHSARCALFEEARVSYGVATEPTNVAAITMV